jgi:hypothetical protein
VASNSNSTSSWRESRRPPWSRPFTPSRERSARRASGSPSVRAAKARPLGSRSCVVSLPATGGREPASYAFAIGVGGPNRTVAHDRDLSSRVELGLELRCGSSGRRGGRDTRARGRAWSASSLAGCPRSRFQLGSNSNDHDSHAWSPNVRRLPGITAASARQAQIGPSQAQMDDPYQPTETAKSISHRALRMMARPGLEPGTPRFSVLGRNLSNCPESPATSRVRTSRRSLVDLCKLRSLLCIWAPRCALVPIRCSSPGLAAPLVARAMRRARKAGTGRSGSVAGEPDGLPEMTRGASPRRARLPRPCGRRRAAMSRLTAGRATIRQRVRCP